MRIGTGGKFVFRVAIAVAAGLLISSEGDAVMLEWMGKRKVVNHHNEVPFHVLEKRWEFGGGPHHLHEDSPRHHAVLISTPSREDTKEEVGYV